MQLASRQVADPAAQQNFDQIATAMTSLEAVAVFTGTGTPEGVLAAPVGSLYTSRSGGAGTTLYVKQSGGSGSTGWAAK